MIPIRTNNTTTTFTIVEKEDFDVTIEGHKDSLVIAERNWMKQKAKKPKKRTKKHWHIQKKRYPPLHTTKRKGRKQEWE